MARRYCTSSALGAVCRSCEWDLCVRTREKLAASGKVYEQLSDGNVFCSNPLCPHSHIAHPMKATVNSGREVKKK